MKKLMRPSHSIGFKTHLFVVASIAITTILLFTLFGNLDIHKVEAAPSLPAGIITSIPITLTNNQSVATPSPFQQMVNIDSATYNSDEASNLQNVEFYDGTGSVIPSWLESGNSNSSTDSVYWLNLANGIPANSSITVYMGFAAPTTNLLSNQLTGEAPQLSPIIGEYDNGGNVFNYYDNFGSSASGWTASAGVSPSIDDGLTVNFPQNGYLVGPLENPGTAFDADVTLNPGEVNIGYINTSETTNYLGNPAWAGTVIREASNNTYPDQMDQTAEANSSGNVSGSIIPGSESITGIFTIMPVSTSSSFQSINYSGGSSTQPITTNAPQYPCQVGFALMSADSVANGMDVQWVRVRAAPPNGVMPLASVAGNLPLTVTSLISSANPSTSGQSVSFTAIVSPNPDGGTVQFQDNGNNLGSPVSLNSFGEANYIDSTLSTGSNNIKAVYSGDNNFASSTGSFAEVINSSTGPWINFGVTGMTGLCISINGGTLPNSAVPGAVITGVVWNWGDGQTMAGWMLETHTYSQNGTYTITATCTQSDGQSSSLSVPVTVNGSATPTTTALTSSANPSVSGQSVTFTASVSPVPNGGTVLFQVDGTCNTGFVTLDSNGQAIFTPSSLPAGSHNIVVSYNGDENFASSTGTVTQVVNTTIAPTINIWITNIGGLCVSINGVTLPTAPGAVITGVVWNWGDGQTMVGWMLETHTYSKPGNYKITATATDSNGQSQMASIQTGLLSGTATQTTTALTSSATLTSSSYQSIFGQSVTFIASVSQTDGGGTVLFQDNGACISNPITLNNEDQAVFTTSSLPVGSQVITASYSGDNNSSSSSGTINLVVNSTLDPTISLGTVNVTGLSVYINGITLPTVAGATIAGITWNWGDNSPTMTGWFPEAHTYNQSGTFTITVTSLDSAGRSQSAFTTVAVSGTPSPTINLPVSAGNTSVTGAAVPNAIIVLSINGTAQPTMTSDATTGDWIVSVTALTAGNTISVTAQLTGQSVSVPALVTLAPPLNSAADLTNLVVASPHSNPSTTFYPTTYNYSYTVADMLADITPNWTQSNATVTVDNTTNTTPNAQTATSGALLAVNPLLPGPNVITITVNMPNAIEIYTIVVTRVTGPLINIVVTPGPTTGNLAVAATQQFTATGIYQDNTQVDLTNSAVWASDNSNVATINSSGLATCVTTGTAYISASLSGVTSPAIGLTVGSPSASPASSNISNRTESLANGNGFITNANGTNTYGVGCIVGLKSDGTVVATGTDTYGDTDVSSWTDITQVACGYYFTVGLEANGTVVATGENNFGQCDVASWTNIIQVTAGEYFVVGLESNGTVVSAGFNGWGQCNVGSWTNIVQLSAFASFTVGLESNGTVVATGLNSFNQCDVNTWTGITQVVAGGVFAVGLESNGTVVVTPGPISQSSVGSWTGVTQLAVEGANGFIMGLESNGSVVCTVSPTFGQASSWTGIVQLAGGWDSVMGLKSDGTVVALGSNPDAAGAASWNLGCGTVATIQGGGATLSQGDGVTIVVQGVNTQTSIEFGSTDYGTVAPSGKNDPNLAVGSQNYDIFVLGSNFDANATATVIVRNSSITAESTIQYQNNQGDWVTINPVTTNLAASPPTISGNVPISLLTGTPWVTGVLTTIASTSTSGIKTTATYSSSIQTITLKATVASTSGTIGAGTVTFTILNGKTVIGSSVTSGTVSGGNAGVGYVLPAGTAAGTYTILASYNGSPNFNASSDNTASLTVNQAPTSTLVTSSVNPSVFGQSVTFTVTVNVVAPGAGTPTGTVQFVLDGNNFGSPVSLAGGSATSSAIPTLSVSTHKVSAVYNGDTNFTTSTGTLSGGQVVNKATSSTVGTNTTSTYSGSNQAVALSAAVTAVGETVNEGTVTFTVQNKNNAVIGKPVTSGTVNGGSANASFTLPGGTPAGTYTIIATYSGGPDFNTSDNGKSPAQLVVNKAPDHTFVISIPNPSTYGSQVIFTALVIPSSINPANIITNTNGGTVLNTSSLATILGSYIPTGSITFMDGTTQLGTVNLSKLGFVTLTTPSLNAGSHTITALYSGDTNYLTSTSSSLSQAVNKANTTLALASSAKQAKSGTSVTFNVTASAVPPSTGTPIGTVTFKNGTSTLGTATLSNGKATFSTSSLPVGTDQITAVYGGDGNFNGGTSNTVSQTITK
jgi:hypothetical protein